MDHFTLPIRVYSDETDSLGIVHHSNYLRYMERARFEWINSLGFSLNDWTKQGVLFVLNKVDIKYLLPAKVFDQIEVFSTIAKHRHASIVYDQTIRCTKNRDIIYCKALVSVVCVNQNLEPRSLPDILSKHQT